MNLISRCIETDRQIPFTNYHNTENFSTMQLYCILKCFNILFSGDFSSRSTSNHLKQHWQNLRENKVQFEFNDALDPFTIDCINKMIKNKLLMEIDGILSCDSK